MAIIRSLLDTDGYKFTMFQLVLHQFSSVQVKYEFICRTKNARLLDYIDLGKLREEFGHARCLRFTEEELLYLEKLTEEEPRLYAFQHRNYIVHQLFETDFIDHLRHYKLPNYNIEVVGDTLRIEFEGPWPSTILWETICLSIVSELYYRGFMQQNNISQLDAIKVGLSRLACKENLLTEYPNLKITDFGTRRRFSRLWQEIVIDYMTKAMSGQFAGTSNAYLAWQYSLPLKATMAHELDQAMQGIILKETDGNYNRLVEAHDRVMDAWEKEYGPSMRINLPDTFGSDRALERMTKERLRSWSGERHDSGDPDSFAQKRIDKWRSVGIDPWGKLIVFSDGLDVYKIVDLYKKFNPVTNVGFGIGTNLTNDMGFPPISIVVKLTESQGYGVVKLSDNLKKATGTPEDIEIVKRIFGYTVGKHEEVIY